MSNNYPFKLDRRTLVKSIGAAGASATLGVHASARADRRSDPESREVLVGVTAGEDGPAAVLAPQVPSMAEVVHENRVLGYATIRFPSDANAASQSFSESITNHPRIRYAEPNATCRALYTPNDPAYSSQHAPQQVRADHAWDTLLGSCGTKIAFVDTGVQHDHPDLDYCSNPVAQYDFVDNDSDVSPDDPSSEYHGTAMAGVGAAKTDNGTGIAGITDASLLFGRALDENGSGSISDISDAIAWAVDQGAHVINLSFGGGYSTTMKDAVSYASNQGALLVGPAGNDGPCTDCVSYPAAYDEVLAVTSLTETNTLSSYSSTGPEVELAAPGTNVLTATTGSRGSYERVSGSSIAAAIVSGVAGLTHSQWGITGSELRRHLKATAVDEGLSNNEQGCGRVDAYNAVNVDPAISGTCGDSSAGKCGDRTYSETVSNSLSGPDDGDCWTWNWEFADPCELVIELDGPLLSDFDLYLNEGTAACPTTSSYDYSASTSDSQEQVVLSEPDTSTPLYILVDSSIGSGSYTLTITEKAR